MILKTKVRILLILDFIDARFASVVGKTNNNSYNEKRMHFDCVKIE